MIGTKDPAANRALHDPFRQPGSDTVLSRPNGVLHNTKIVYRSKDKTGGAPVLLQEESWNDSRAIVHRHSDGTLLNATFGKLPLWMSKPGLDSFRRYRSIPFFLAGEPYGYSNMVYKRAATIYERLAIRKDGTKSLIQYGKLTTEPLEFDTVKIKRQSFELAYQALKYQELLEEILIDSGFLFAHAMADDQMGLVMVMLFDFQNRKWAARCRLIGEEIDPEVSTVENALYDHKVRLAAALAKCRVKNQSLSIDYILPENVRNQEKCGSTLPQSTWVNTLKTSVDEISKRLVEMGFSEICGKEENLLPLRGKYFHRDCHCDDVILFPWDQKEYLKSLEIVQEGLLILQDKTSSLAVQAMTSLLTEDDEYDILHTDVASGLTTAHLAISLHNMTKEQVEMRARMYQNPLLASRVLDNSDDEDESQEQKKPIVYACGVTDEHHKNQLTKLFDNMGITNVKLISKKFEEVETDGDSQFQRVKLILCTPQCTRTAVSNPIEFMLMEGDKETYNILRDLSHGRHNDHAAEAGKRHLATLKHALKFHSIQACVYIARSVHEEENEHVVNAAIKWQRQHTAGTLPFRICPPTVPLMARDLGKQNSKSLSNKFLHLRQSPTMNGCFLAVLSREIGHDSMTVKDIIRRAALKGLVKPASTVTEQKTKKAATEKSDHADSEDEKKKVKKKTSSAGHSAVSRKKSTKSLSLTKHSKAVNKMAEMKTVDANDVNRLLGLYNQKKNEAKSEKREDGAMTQVNMNLAFQAPNSSEGHHFHPGHKSPKNSKKH